MIKCWNCPLQDICEVPKVNREHPFPLEWISDEGKSLCPLCMAIYNSTEEARVALDGKEK